MKSKPTPAGENVVKITTVQLRRMINEVRKEVNEQHGSKKDMLSGADNPEDVEAIEDVEFGRSGEELVKAVNFYEKLGLDEAKAQKKLDRIKEGRALVLKKIQACAQSPSKKKLRTNDDHHSVQGMRRRSNEDHK